MAAACALLPEVRAFAVKHVKTEDLIVCLPQRDSLYIFPRPSDETLVAMQRQIKKDNELARKPLSNGLFAFEAAGLRELGGEESV